MSEYDSDVLREVDCDDECCGVRWDAADIIDRLQQRTEDDFESIKFLLNENIRLRGRKIDEEKAMITYRHDRVPPMKIIMLLEIYGLVFEECMSTFNGSLASAKFIQELLDDELIEVTIPSQFPSLGKTHCRYKTTRRGDAMVDKVCRTEYPVLEERWI